MKTGTQIDNPGTHQCLTWNVFNGRLLVYGRNLHAIGGSARNPITGELYPNKFSTINTRHSLEIMENAPAAISHPADKGVSSYNILDQLLKLPEGIKIPSQKVDTHPSISLGSKQIEPMISSSMQKKGNDDISENPSHDQGTEASSKNNS
jgi:hypothetical protein